MNAYITIEQLYYNNSLMNFFFREQAKNTLEELLEKSTLSRRDTLEVLDNYAEGEDLDTIEEMFYNDSVEEIAAEIELALTDEEDDEEDE